MLGPALQLNHRRFFVLMLLGSSPVLFSGSFP
jgi:hypothetical protein